LIRSVYVLGFWASLEFGLGWFLAQRVGAHRIDRLRMWIHSSVSRRFCDHLETNRQNKNHKIISLWTVNKSIDLPDKNGPLQKITSGFMVLGMIGRRAVANRYGENHPFSIAK